MNTNMDDKILSKHGSDSKEKTLVLVEVNQRVSLEKDQRSDRPQPTQKKRSSSRLMLFICSASYMFLFGGAFWGWAPMQLMLERSGAFNSLCPRNDEVDAFDASEKVTDDKEGSCPEQRSMLINVQLVGQLAMVVSPFLGAIGDRYGSSALMNVLCASGIIGISFLIAAVSLGIDLLLFPAFLGLGLMAVASSIMTVLTSLEFEGVWVKRSISTLNALYDAGSVTYLILLALENYLGVSLTVIAFGYLFTALLSVGGAVFYWNRVNLEKDQNVSIHIASADREDITMLSEDNVSNSEKDCSSTDEEIGHETPKSSVLVEMDTLDSGKDAYTAISSRTPAKQLRSTLFVMLAVYFSLIQSRIQFALTTARDFLAFLGDDDFDNLYMTIFTLLLPASILALPLVDIVLRKCSAQTAFQTINLMALTHGLIQVCFSSLNVQVVGFVVFTILRCFIFSIIFSVLASFLSPDAMGKGAGILIFAVGIGIFWNIPLSNLAMLAFDGNFFVPNLLYTLIVIPFFFITVWMGRLIKKDYVSRNGNGE